MHNIINIEKFENYTIQIYTILRPVFPLLILKLTHACEKHNKDSHNSRL